MPNPAPIPKRKREDPVLIAGQGCFVDDVVLRDALSLSFVRNTVVGEIVAVESKEALQAPGVRAVHVAADVAGLGALSVNPVIPLIHKLAYAILAGPQLRAVGQPVAAVLAETLSQALDGAELVEVEVDETLHQAQEIAAQDWQFGDAGHAFEVAHYVVHCEVRHARLAPSPMEPRGIAVAYHPENGSVTIWHSTQTPHRTRSELSAILDVDATRIRVIARHVGGAFGMKASLYPEEVCAVWAAFQHKRSVKWVATRSEEFLSAIHGRGIFMKGALALDRNGKFLALRAKAEAPIGPWLPNSGLVPAWNAGRILPTGYRVGAIDVQTHAVQSGLGPIGIYRGAGRPEANCLMERLIDKAARETGRDPVALRLANLVPSGAMPFGTVTGNTLDSGEYGAALERLVQANGYAELIAMRDQRRAAGELVGVGLAFYVEPSGSGWESAQVTRNADGTAFVASGSSSQGHGRETAFARIAGDALGMDPARVSVVLGDTKSAPAGIGALASRATAIGGSAVLQACEEVAARRAGGEALPITADVRYENKGQAWGYGAYLVVLHVDAETGAANIERAACIDDAGVLIDPDQVHDQILGGFAQGVGEAMCERLVHDADGQLLSGSFMDYAMPRAADIPPLHIDKMETPSPMNLLGAKGIGEAGTIGAPAAIMNAAIDALSPLGVTDLQMPLTPATLWQAMQDAKER